jgi:VWFA-related protein
MRISGLNLQSLLLAGLLASPWPALAQTEATVPSSEPRSQESVPTLRFTTALVEVDVVVARASGEPVTDLTRDDFTLLEDGRVQPLAAWSMERPQAQAAGKKPPPPLPEFVYTNHPSYRVSPGPLTVILLDALNTELADQIYSRKQVLRYLEEQPVQGQRTAVLGLASRLILLQDFTDDPQLVRAALEGHGLERSALLDDPQGAAFSVPRGAVASNPQAAAILGRIHQAVERFEAERARAQVDSRVATTLGALRAIARAVSAYPGRKKLIWVSSAFPLVFEPENPSEFGLRRTYADEIARTVNVLANAQVAVYPVDARGLVGSFLGGAASSGLNPFGRRPAAQGLVVRQSSRLFSSQGTMQTLADETGGRAFLNSNDLDRALALAAEDGSVYYSLAYRPPNRRWNGRYRNIRVKVARPALRLRYRRGYFAVDPMAAPAASINEPLENAVNDVLPSTGLVFYARVVPPAPAPRAKVKVEFLVHPETVVFEQLADGTRRSNLEFAVAAFTPEGKPATLHKYKLEATLPSPAFSTVRKDGLPFPVEVELDAGAYELRLAARDLRTGLLGVTTAPLLLKKD